jgi:hypothetical protein
MKEGMQMGKVIFEEEKYFLEIEGQRQELPVAAVGDEARLKELVGQEVEILYSEPKRDIVGLVAQERMAVMICPPWPPWPPWPPPPPPPWPPWPPPWPPCFMCYLPPIWLIEGVEREVQTNLAKRFLEEGYISEEVFNRLV